MFFEITIPQVNVECAVCTLSCTEKCDCKKVSRHQLSRRRESRRNNSPDGNVARLT